MIGVEMIGVEMIANASWRLGKRHQPGA